MVNLNRRRRGFSLIELLIVVAIILILVTVAAVQLPKALMHVKETAALVGVKAIQTAQILYSSSFNRYATSLAELGPPQSGQPNASASGVIGADLSNGLKQGYKFTVTGRPGGYTVVAVPESYGSSGSKSFYSDETMTIHEHYGPEQATAEDPIVR
jgi:prepilin-type N-terminal cleavage/methylation domain-containing protein